MKNKKLIFILAIIIFLIIFVFIIFFNNFSLLPKKEEIIEICPKSSANSVAKTLKEKGIILNEKAFLIYLSLTNNSTKILPGKYLLNNKMTLSQITQKLVSGDRIKQKITIVEGATRKDIAKILAKNNFFSEKDFLEKTQNLEGYLFPDTYEILPCETLDDFINQIKENFDKKTKDIKDRVNQEEFKKMIILASLLEKEVKNYEDKQIVAGILLKRLQNNWFLQVDASIGYALDKPLKELTSVDLQIDSPYNTYKYKGLPPTPICNPGLESILAVLYHKDSDYWYYLSTPQGKTIFSKTLEEHNLAIKKYYKQ